MSKPTVKSLDNRCFDMYEQAVQDTESDIEFVEDMFRLEKLQSPNTLREDFCGTAKLAADWVKSNRNRHATGVDIDSKTLDAAEQRNRKPLPPQQCERLQLVQSDVRKGPAGPFDVVVGFNFSYCVFHERSDLLDWMRNAHAALKAPGALMMDVTGGSEYTSPCLESRSYPGFKYYWEQMPYNPITGLAKRYIHFKPKKEKKIKRAFTYDWRLWHLPELVDVAKDAGFANVEVYWEGATEDGEGDGQFVCETEAEQEESWIAYIVAWK